MRHGRARNWMRYGERKWGRGAFFVLAVALSLGFSQVASGLGNITTVAGTGTAGFSGDGGPATSAQLDSPEGVAVDGSGNLFIADRDNHRIRKVDTNGVITTVAGTGTAGFSGDGGPATSAQLNIPRGIAVDGAGNLFIADAGNSRIRKVDANGTITTVAGTGTGGFSGDGGPATSANLSAPSGVAVDGVGNFFIADTLANRIRKVDSNGIITTVAGTGGGGSSGDDGPATSAQVSGPFAVAFDGAGNLFIAAIGGERIRKVDTNGIITTVAGTGTGGFNGDGGPATSAQLKTPAAIAFDGVGNLFIADEDNQRIRKVDANGTITTVAGTGTGGFNGDGGPATSAQLNGPFGVAVDGAGNLFIADRTNLRIRKVFETTAPVVTVDALTTNDDTPELTGTIDDITAIIDVTVNGQINTATNNGDATWTLADNTLTPLAANTYDVSVTATDGSGNVGTDSTTDELVIFSGSSGQGTITINLPRPRIEEGNRLDMTAPDGSNYQWKKNGKNLSDDPPRITGTNSQTLVFDPILESDAGVYRCVYDTVAKALVETGPFVLEVLPQGSLPAAGVIGLCLLAGAFALAGARAMRRRA